MVFIYQDLEKNDFSFLYIPYYQGETGLTELVDFMVERVAYEDEDFREAMDISKFKAGFWILLGDILLGLSKASGYIAKIIY